MIIGTAGHIDHGKTALVKALTGVDTDRLLEEKQRGITIDLGYAYYSFNKPFSESVEGKSSGSTSSPTDIIGFIDVPGHEKLIHNMLAGAISIDYVLLVVAADDGLMPQTHEHLQIINLLNIRHGAVAITKIDRVSAAQIASVSNDIQSLLQTTSLANSRVFPVSAITGEGIPELRQQLETAATTLHKPLINGHFRLAVDRSFSLSGIGTVVTGTVFSGKVQINDKLVISPSGLPVRVRGIHAQNQVADTGYAGQRCALNIVGTHVDKQAVHRGDWIIAEEIHAPIQRFDGQLQLATTATKALKHWTPVHCHLGASDVLGRVATLTGEIVTPHQTALVQIVLDKPIAALHGDRFIIRDQSASYTIGGGIVLDPFPPQRGKRTPERLAALQAMQTHSPEEALRLLLDNMPVGIELAKFAQSWNLLETEAANLWQALSLKIVNKTQGFSNACWEELAHSVLIALKQEHERLPDELGISVERLRHLITPILQKSVFSALINELLETKQIAKSGAWLYLPEHKIVLNSAESKLWHIIKPLLATQPPPRVRDIAKQLNIAEEKIRSLLRRVARLGEVYLVAHDHYFTQEAVNRLAKIAHTIATTQQDIQAAVFRDQIGMGRKVTIQILEFFDRIGFTQRKGDARQLRQATVFHWED